MRIILICCLVFVSVIFGSGSNPTVIVLTDIGGDTDDEQSMVRFLLYSNMFNVKAICATSRLGHGQDTKPELIRKQIKCYGEVYPNLLLHSPDYPSPKYLLSIIKDGLGSQFKLGYGFDSEASDFIVKIVDEAAETVHILIWGGQRELAQALWKIRSSRNEEQIFDFCKKIQVNAIGNQDGYRNWIINNFKDIRYYANGFSEKVTTSLFRGMYMTGDTSLQYSHWVKKNIHEHGALSNCYPLHGHGTNGMKEGDSPTFLGLIENGLNVPKKPEWGGWGGRFSFFKDNLYIDASDYLNGIPNERHTVSRWRPAFQRDFMTRLNWCVEPYSSANHNPVIKIKGFSEKAPLILHPKTGDKLIFDASESFDPDGDRLSFKWYFYDELSNIDNLKIKIHQQKKCTIKIPQNFNAKSIHLILEVVDNGIPVLTSYKRIVLKVI